MQTRILRSRVILALGKADLISGKLLKAIKQNPSTALWYVRWVMNRLWPEAEGVISQDAGPALAYARDILHKPWPMGEPAIFKDRNCTYYYGDQVYKIPFNDITPWVEAHYTGVN